MMGVQMMIIREEEHGDLEERMKCEAAERSEDGQGNHRHTWPRQSGRRRRVDEGGGGKVDDDRHREGEPR